jgi:hypothetical protein
LLRADFVWSENWEGNGQGNDRSRGNDKGKGNDEIQGSFAPLRMTTFLVVEGRCWGRRKVKARRQRILLGMKNAQASGLRID